jgi:hypothetical protein
MNKEATNAFLRVERGRVEEYRESEEIPLGIDVTVIGRHSRSTGAQHEHPDVRIKDDYVSRGHLRIYYSYEHACFLLKEPDTGTKNGTFINGERIQPGMPCKLKNGDLIGLAKVGGDYRVIFRFRASEGTLRAISQAAKPLTPGLKVDPGARRTWVDGKEVPLRKKEFELLAFLYQNSGRACSKNEIAEKVWAEESGIVSEETIDQNIHRIRKEIEQDLSNPRYIRTLPRYGYRLDL